MSEDVTLLHSSTRAISNSQDAIYLIEQKERIESAITRQDAALVLDTCKAYLESLFKTVLKDRDASLNSTLDMSPLYRAVRDVIPLNRDTDACTILTRLTNQIVHCVAELRNKYGAASHGDDGYYENPIQMVEAEMVVQCVDGLAAFIYTKHKEQNDPQLAARIHYSDYPEFNDFMDLQHEGYSLQLSDRHHLSITASELIFRTDVSAYREMLLQYISTEAEDAG